MIFPARELTPTDRRASTRRRRWWRPSRGGASSGSGWPRAPTSRAWSRGCRGSSTSRAVDHRRPARHRQGRADRAAADARPGHRAAGRGGRSRQGAGVDVGTRSRQGRSRACTPSPTQLLAEAGSFWTIDSTPEIARHAGRAGVRLGPDRRRRRPGSTPAWPSCSPRVPRRRRRRRCTGRRHACARSCSSTDSTSRSSTARPGCDRAGRADRRRPTPPRRARCPTPSWRSSPSPTSPAAAAPTARPRPQRDRQLASSRTSSPATTSSTTCTASATTRAWSSARSAAIERDYLLVAVQGRRQAVRAVRPDRHAAPVRRGRGAHAAPPRRQRLRQVEEPGAIGGPRDRPGARRALPEAGQRRGPRVPARHAVAARDGGGLPVRRDARPAAGDRRRQARHGAASTRWTA